jgi:hypothetical protein
MHHAVPSNSSFPCNPSHTRSLPLCMQDNRLLDLPLSVVLCKRLLGYACPRRARPLGPPPLSQPLLSILRVVWAPPHWVPVCASVSPVVAYLHPFACPRGHRSQLDCPCPLGHPVPIPCRHPVSLADLAGVDAALAQTMRLLQGIVDSYARETRRAAEGAVDAAGNLAKLRAEVESMVRCSLLLPNLL